jgi:hypothetical protein
MFYVPSTGKSSNSSSSSSCAPGFCGCSGWLVSFESVVRPALVVGALAWGAPDILGEFVWVVWVGSWVCWVYESVVVCYEVECVWWFELLVR